MTITLILAAVCVAGAAFSAWRGAQPARIGKPRMAPWRFLMVAFAAMLLLLLVHLVNMAGGGSSPMRFR